MPQLAVIDDRAVYRRSVERILKVLPSGWGPTVVAPLEDMEEYVGWIDENEVAALLIDERLNEETARYHQPLGYSGHELARFLRKRCPDLPIFILTAVPEDDNLADCIGDTEGIVSKKEFGEQPKKYVERFVRAGERFFDSHRKQLVRLAELSRLVAEGTASSAHKEELGALQTSLGIAYPDQLGTRTDIIDSIEKKLGEFDRLKDKIEAIIKKTKAKQ